MSLDLTSSAVALRRDRPGACAFARHLSTKSARLIPGSDRSSEVRSYLTQLKRFYKTAEDALPHFARPWSISGDSRKLERNRFPAGTLWKAAEIARSPVSSFVIFA